jgi:hypothetical protein
MWCKSNKRVQGSILIPQWKTSRPRLDEIGQVGRDSGVLWQEPCSFHGHRILSVELDMEVCHENVASEECVRLRKQRDRREIVRGRCWRRTYVRKKNRVYRAEEAESERRCEFCHTRRRSWLTSPVKGKYKGVTRLCVAVEGVAGV